MTEEQMRKQRFVDRKLAPCVVAATEGGIAQVDYAAKGCSECVTLTYHDGYRQRVNVSMDSLSAIVRDVFAAIKG